ncbi:peroxidase family protein [Cupriavidus pampae]|uniref:Heme peroxidase n=1 Tax=Cupriavidus pampae TaxID=659251 RepID=A0ABM8WYJ3_9BURK|nr:heme peroxidase family protein [Cupriavidus pampae]CAG9172635.1 hypothetical protein LMG32289_02640 [Cupriavidus pampae]
MEPTPQNHGQCTAHANAPRSNVVKPGRFGRLFPELPPWTTGDTAKDRAVASELATAMHANQPIDGVIPAGFTYLGQFIDHDMTFDPTSIGENAVDLDDLKNFRTPALDLDCLYGSGPRDQPFLYLRSSGTKSEQFIVGPVVRPPAGAPGADHSQAIALDGHTYDLPRVCDGISEHTAILGDRRNDENLIVAQLHRTMLHFHNAVCLHFPQSDFRTVRKTVMHYYQHVLLNQFLPMIAGKTETAEALAQLKYYRIGVGEAATEPFIPLEFSGAAYRFGHSMIRSGYKFNAVFPGNSTNLIFQFTGSGFPPALHHYPTNWLLNWKQFFPDLGGSPQVTKAIDPLLAPELVIGPDKVPLALLNLERGSTLHYCLPSGQQVSKRMCTKPLSKEALESGPTGAVIKKFNLGENTPLWFYILKEAEVSAGGTHLGPIGGTIVAEVMVGLLRSDPESVLNSTADALPVAGKDFKIGDLFKFVESKKGQSNIPAAGVINPLGD